VQSNSPVGYVRTRFAKHGHSVFSACSFIIRLTLKSYSAAFFFVGIGSECLTLENKRLRNSPNVISIQSASKLDEQYIRL
jgi:hypothetical protein